VNSGASGILDTIWASSSAGAWAAGAQGTILRHP
jgi:hypothetical protein